MEIELRRFAFTQRPVWLIAATIIALTAVAGGQSPDPSVSPS